MQSLTTESRASQGLATVAPRLAHVRAECVAGKPVLGNWPEAEKARQDSAGRARKEGFDATD